MRLVWPSSSVTSSSLVRRSLSTLGLITTCNISAQHSFRSRTAAAFLSAHPYHYHHRSTATTTAFLPNAPSFASSIERRRKISAAKSSDSDNMSSTSTTAPVDATLFWNRETAAAAAESSKQQSELPQPIIKQARIVAIADPNDKANEPLHKLLLNDNKKSDDENIQLLQIGSCIDDFDVPALKQAGGPNVVFVAPSCPQARETLAALVQEIPDDSLEWIHARSAGIDFCTSTPLQEWWSSNNNNNNKKNDTSSADDDNDKKQQEQPQPQQQSRVMTNAKGQFSSTLAEYTLLACAYFAKDLPRLLCNQRNKKWEKYPVLELRGALLGIVGYGDIGKAVAKLAKGAYGMKVRALQRSRKKQNKQKRKLDDDGSTNDKTNNNNKSEDDPYCDEIVYMEDDDDDDDDNDKNKKKNTALNQLFADCDYILSALPLTPATQGMIGKEQFDQVKPGRRTVFINVGRGPTVDEKALIAALASNDDDDDPESAEDASSGRGRLRGAGLDVFEQEPLPTDSPLWTMDNVLLSPHNMDQTETFMEEATTFFVDVNLPRFVRGLPLLNPVNPVNGY